MTGTAEAIVIGEGAALPGAGVPWLDARRAAAIAAFREKGVPHRRIEDWKYTDLKAALEAANDTALGTVGWSLGDRPDGVALFDLAELASAPGWVSERLGESADGRAMAAASLALARSGFALRVAKNRAVAAPLRLEFSGTGHARALIVLDEGAELTLVETQKAGTGFRNIGVEVFLGRNARLTHIRIADAAPEMIQVCDVVLRVERDATYQAHLVNGGASLARLTLGVTLDGPGASTHLSGVTVLGGSLHADVTTEILHASGQTRSTQLFKKVVGGKGHAVYQGRIKVSEGANGSDSIQTAKALLLGDRAEADLKPELEIFADDVKCAHGAAVGDLDPESLFYLRSRGIPEAEARNLLIHAFIGDALDAIARDDLRKTATDIVEHALARALEQVP